MGEREQRSERLVEREERSWMEREITWSEERRRENGGAGRDGGQTDRR